VRFRVGDLVRVNGTGPRVAWPVTHWNERALIGRMGRVEAVDDPSLEPQGYQVRFDDEDRLFFEFELDRYTGLDVILDMLP